MPERKNPTRRSALLACALAAMILLAALPATAAWYATQSAAAGSAIATATFAVEADTRSKTESGALTRSDLAELSERYEEALWDSIEVADALYYGATVVTVTADRDNTASGYLIVTYNNSDYYSDFIAPGERVAFTVPGGTVRGSDGKITVSGKDARGNEYSSEFVIEAGWGQPEGKLTLKDLQEALDAQTAELIALQKEAYLQELADRLAQAKQAAEEAANQAGQTTEAGAELTDIFAGS